MRFENSAAMHQPTRAKTHLLGYKRLKETQSKILPDIKRTSRNAHNKSGFIFLPNTLENGHYSFYRAFITAFEVKAFCRYAF